MIFYPALRAQDLSSLLFKSDSIIMYNSACNDDMACYTILHDTAELLNSSRSRISSIDYFEFITKEALKDSILLKDIIRSNIKRDSISYTLLRFNMNAYLFQKLEGKGISFIISYLDDASEFNGLPSPYYFRNLISIWQLEWFADSDLRLLYILNLAIFKNEIEVDQNTEQVYEK